MNLLFVTAYLHLKGMWRASRYGLQFLLLPMLMISIFLTAYLAVRAMGGQIQELFYPFVVFILSASAINIPMQAGNQLLSDSSSAHFWVTSRGLGGLLTYFLGIQVVYLANTIISIIIAFFLSHPKLYFINSICGLILLALWCISLVIIGLAIGMRYLFAFHLAQLIFLGFYPFLMMLSLTDKPVYAFVLPPAGIIAILKSQNNLPGFFLTTLGGILVYILAGIAFLKWAYREYRIGKGVNRI